MGNKNSVVSGEINPVHLPEMLLDVARQEPELWGDETGAGLGVADLIALMTATTSTANSQIKVQPSITTMDTHGAEDLVITRLPRSRSTLHITVGDSAARNVTFEGKCDMKDQSSESVGEPRIRQEQKPSKRRRKIRKCDSQTTILENYFLHPPPHVREILGGLRKPPVSEGSEMGRNQSHNVTGQ